MTNPINSSRDAGHPSSISRSPEFDQEDVVAELASSVRNTVIEHPAFFAGIAAIRRCHRMGRFGLDEPGCLLITGVSGSGKSTLRKEYANLYPCRQTSVGMEMPVLHLELPAQPTIKNVAERILIALGDPLFYRGSAEAMTARIVILFSHCRVELVILDEFQHFIDHASEKIETKVADWLKHLVNITKVPFVLMGLDRCRRILQGNEQLRRRFSRQIALEPFSISDKKTRRIFGGLIQSIWRNLPVPVSPELSSNGVLLERMHFATFGLIGYVMTLVSTSVEIMLEESFECIDREVLSKAFATSIWPQARGRTNPFHPDFTVRPLTNAGEPFYGYAR